MIDEAMAALSADRRVALDINESSFDPKDEQIRPAGWAVLRDRRVAAREQADVRGGVSATEVANKHATRVKEEENMMIKEAATYGNVLLVDTMFIQTKKPLYFLSGKVEMQYKFSHFEFGLRKGAISRTVFDGTKKPVGWNEVRNKRILYREQIARLHGATDEQIQQSSAVRKLQVYNELLSTSYNSIHVAYLLLNR